MQGLQEEDALVLIPDENDAFSYNQLLAQLWELHNVEAHPVATLFSKVVSVFVCRIFASRWTCG
jgi:hypothetical protein